MGIKRGVWRQGERPLVTEHGREELVMSDDPVLDGGVNPYEAVGAVAARQFARRERECGGGPDGGCNPSEHGSKTPERAWNGAGLDTRDCDNKASWLESRLARNRGK